MGAVVHYLEAPVDDVIKALPGYWRKPKPTGKRLADALPDLAPYKEPWTRLLAAPCGRRWTALVNNSAVGDSSAPGPGAADALGVRCAVASHHPGTQTQLELFGPTGEPPLMYVRTISATAEDSRWIWHSDGDPLPFEETERYSARRIKDRFDRDLLLRYLEALGIPAATDDAYGPAKLVRRWG